jgi:hypothetical protein
MASSDVPQVGVPTSKDTINAKLGANSSSLKKSVAGLQDLKLWADSYDADQLSTAFGFTLDEANLVKSALGEVQQFVSAINSLAFLDKTWGA